MDNIDQKNGEVTYNELFHFKLALDQYFSRKYWSFDNLSDLQKLRMKLAKFAVDLYERKIKRAQST